MALSSNAAKAAFHRGLGLWTPRTWQGSNVATECTHLPSLPRIAYFPSTGFKSLSSELGQHFLSQWSVIHWESVLLMVELGAQLTVF